MSSDDSDQETVYCINCGEEISVDTTFCPECGSKQDLDEIDNDNSVTSNATKSNDDSDNKILKYGKYTAWAWGILLIMVGLGSFIEGSLQGVASGVIALGLGLFFLPIIRQKAGIGNLPGISDGNTSRRNVLTGIGYGFGSLLAFGVVAPETETDGSDSAGDGQETTDGNGESDSNTVEESSSPEFAVRVIYSGSWQGAISVTGGGSSQSESISGTGTETIEITGDVDILSANAQKQDDSSEELTVQILQNGDVVSEASTSSAYGVAQTSQSFY